MSKELDLDEIEARAKDTAPDDDHRTAVRDAEDACDEAENSGDLLSCVSHLDDLFRDERRRYREDVPALVAEVRRLRAAVAHYRDREAHFARVLHVTDGGQYRADWDSAIQSLLAEVERLRALLDRVKGGG